MEKDFYMQLSLYKESYYNFKVTLEDGRLMIYNTKTGAISLLDSDEKDVMETVISDNSGLHDSFELLESNCVKNNLSRKESTLFEDLLHRGFLVKKDKDEQTDIKNYYERYKRVNNTIKLIILPAEACNFSCPYCFVYKQRNLYMNDWVYDAMYQYIVNKVLQSNNKTLIQLSWYGGEPLLASDKIITFMKRVNLLKKEYNLEIESSLYTNGYLLTSELFKQLLECGISTFQVTIDGDRNSHDKLRRLKNGKATFDVIFSNLLDIKGMVGKEKEFKFYIRGNFLKSSTQSMEELLSKFTSDLGEDKRFKIYFRPVYHFETTRNDVKRLAKDICDSDEGVNSQIALAFQVLNKMQKESIEDNVNVFKPLPQPMYDWCTGRSGNTYIIGADGAVFLCDTMMVEKDKSVGQITVDGNICLNERAKPWTESVFNDPIARKIGCLQCRLLPVCLGGCKLSMDSGHNPCLWNEKLILDSMKKYVDRLCKEDSYLNKHECSL